MNRSLKIAMIALVAAMLLAPTLFQAHAQTTPLYDLTGTWTWLYTYPKQEDPLMTENHTMAINYSQTATGYFSGFGFNNNSPGDNWTVVGYEYLPHSDSGSGINVNFTITYDQNSPKANYYIYATGSFSTPSNMSGTATLLTPSDDSCMPATWVAVKTSPDANVILNFPPGISIQSVSVIEYPSASPYPPLLNAIGPIYNITVVKGTSTPSLASSSLAGRSLTSGFAGLVTIGIHYDPSLVNDPSKLVIAQFDFLLGDVNHDGKVNPLDLLVITKALFSTPKSRNWNPNCDLNGDGRVDLKDLCLALQNLGKTAKWNDRLTTVDTANNFVYCTTDHLSGIGIHIFT
ncbi:MAG TPA: dockerin type I domain-containing protein [candidate division Zixibacteria bacterium]|nr:dockerin type I domain-containing protein [candidate division Zixibacteria bacterium]